MDVVPFLQIGMLVFWLLAFATNIAAFWRILPRSGLSSWLALLAVIPPVAVILFWVIAFKRWPGDVK